MLKILVCGTEKNVTEINKRLRIDCSVMGYTDICRKIKKYKLFDGTPYGYICNFIEKRFDYLVISYSKENDIKNALTEFDYIKDKIIVFEWFKDSTIADTASKFMLSSLRFEQLVFGMSHSENDIQTQLMEMLTYKFSLPSMDIFCQYNIVKKILYETPECFSSVKSIILELPYYIFNYDLSKSVRSVKKRLYYFKTFDNYHNYGNSEEEKNTILEFDNYLKIFNFGNPAIYGNNFDECMTEKYGRCLKDILRYTFSLMAVLRDKQNVKVWRDFRKDTILENIEIFKKLVCLLKNNIKNVRITILICPFNPAFVIQNRKYINKSKEQFYSIINSVQANCDVKFNILDTFTGGRILDFLDHCHLNQKAAKKYTLMIERKLQNV